jgi:hypothetical protein
VAGWDVNHLVRLVAEDDIVPVRVDGRPPSEEDGVFEHGLDSLLLEPPLLVQEKRSGDRGTFGVADDAVEGALVLHDLEEILEGIVGTPVGGSDSFAHQLTHGVLRGFAVWKVTDPAEDIVLVRLLNVLVGLDEAVVRRIAKVLLESLRRRGFAWTMDEMEASRAILEELFDERRFSHTSKSIPSARASLSESE